MYNYNRDYDRKISYSEQGEILELLIGHRAVKVSNDSLILDNGVTLTFVGNDGCGGCPSGEYDLTELNGVNNIITNVEFVNDPSGDDCEDGRGQYKIFVYADNQKINLASFDGSDGNGYYGSGYSIHVKLGNAA